MKQVLRTFGIATLVAATVHATAGICLCHRGTDAPVAMPGSHPCCRGDGDGATTALRGVDACCQIETAQREMTPIDAIQLAQPVANVIDHLVAADEAVRSPSFRPAFAPSPPVWNLRL